VITEVTESAGTKDPIRNGVGHYVSVGSRFHPPRFVNHDTGQENWWTAGKTMGVKAKPDAKLRAALHGFSSGYLHVWDRLIRASKADEEETL
jgi:hypothetical protein